MKTMAPLNVIWTDFGQSYERMVDNMEQALDLTKDLASCGAQNPTMMEFFEPDEKGRGLAIGVGRAHTVLTYQESLDPPYYISLGDVDSEDVTTFYYGCQETEYLLRNIVTAELGREALKFFLEARTKPKNINWEKL